MQFSDKLRCPVTQNGLQLIEKGDFVRYLQGNEQIPGDPQRGYIDTSGQYFFPVINEIILLHEQYALFTGKGKDIRKGLSFDKKRVFDYYNEVDFKIKESLSVYGDSPKWVDYRQVSENYIRNSFTKASRFFPSTGKYFLDIASGPIGLPEYMELSTGYEYRVCVDISVNALVQARINVENSGRKGIFICGDITNIPIKDNSCDTVLSQHTLYHIPKDEQKTAVEEMYRVAKPGSKVVIIYSWFYHSWFMNLSLNVIQLYRIARHFAGKLYVRLIKSKPRLYFYVHSPSWFRRSFDFSSEIEFHSWRSTNKYFLDMFIHNKLGGKKILEFLGRMEDKYSRFMSTFGEYPVIVITKKK